jgi:RNA polymerase sigma-70 factor (ECF subfamily)
MYTMSSESIEHLIGSALAGNREASEKLVSMHRRLVESVAYQALRNHDDAKDVAQETLVYMIQRLPELRNPGKFSAWVRQLTLTHCTDYRRRRGTRLLGTPIHDLTEASEEADYAIRISIRQSVSDLKESHRTALLMHYVGGWSIAEIAELIEVPPNTVRSRLMAAKRQVRAELRHLFDSPNPMTANQTKLNSSFVTLIERAFADASILDVQSNPEPWQPFGPRVQLQLENQETKTVDFRTGYTPFRIQLNTLLETQGIPGPRIIDGPQAPDGLVLTELPRGENLSFWTLGGTPHRIRIATERAVEGLDRLQACTDALRNSALAGQIETRTLTDELATLTDDARWNANPWLAEEGKHRTAWLNDPWFADAIAKVRARIPQVELPLVYTGDHFFFPQNYRIAGETEKNEILEFTHEIGHFGDPILGLAMVWVYDCYPFVHTGFVEQILWRRGVSRQDFAPRLVLKALQMIARDLPVARPSADFGYHDALTAWAKNGLAWM